MAVGIVIMGTGQIYQHTSKVISVLHPQGAFVLPQTFPVTRDTLNYAGVAVGIVMLGTVIFWFLPGGLGARNWYRGEIKTARVEFDSVRL